MADSIHHLSAIIIILCAHSRIDTKIFSQNVMNARAVGLGSLGGKDVSVSILSRWISL